MLIEKKNSEVNSILFMFLAYQVAGNKDEMDIGMITENQTHQSGACLSPRFSSAINEQVL